MNVGKRETASEKVQGCLVLITEHTVQKHVPVTVRLLLCSTNYCAVCKTDTNLTNPNFLLTPVHNLAHQKSHFSKACSIHSHITSVQHKLLFSLQNRHKLHKFSASQRVLGVCRLGKKPLSCHSGTVWCWVFSHFALKQWSQKWTLGKAQGHLYGTEAWKVPGCSALLRAEPISDIRAAEGQTSLLKSHQKPRMTLSSSIARDMGIPTIIWKISSTSSSLLQR